jgi:hypothetical protein
MASPYDLTTLAAVKQWLTIANANSDAELTGLITAVSRAFYAYMARPSLLPRTITERYDGQGQTRMFLKNWPVLAVTAVNQNGVVVQPSSLPNANSPATFGWLLDPWDGAPPGRNQPLDFIYGQWWRGSQNVQVTYQAGYAVQSEAWTVPAATPYQIAPMAPYGPWGSDLGVFYADGTALVAVPTAPAEGQYSVAAGLYTFAAADAGAAIAISYGFIPADIFEAATEQVGERFSYQTRIGQISKSLGGQETMSYSQRDMPAWVKSVLAPYRATMVPI